MSNPQQTDRIRELYRKTGGDIRKVAKELGLKLHDVSRAINAGVAVIRSEVQDETQRPTRNEKGQPMLGNPNLRPFIVSYRHCMGQWPNEDRKAIVTARKQYDAGTHIVTQGRDGAWIVLYCWRRERPIPPLNYFYGVML